MIQDGGITAALKIVLAIIFAMAFGAGIVAMTVLGEHLMLLGFCVALVMMSFISLPLIVASIGDAREH